MDIINYDEWLEIAEININNDIIHLSEKFIDITMNLDEFNFFYNNPMFIDMFINILHNNKAFLEKHNAIIINFYSNYPDNEFEPTYIFTIRINNIIHEFLIFYEEDSPLFFYQKNKDFIGKKYYDYDYDINRYLEDKYIYNNAYFVVE